MRTDSKGRLPATRKRANSQHRHARWGMPESQREPVTIAGLNSLGLIPPRPASAGLCFSF